MSVWHPLTDWLLCTATSSPRCRRPAIAYGTLASIQDRLLLFSVGQADGKGGLKGYDAGKKVNSRKRHLLVDVLGLVLCAVVLPANIQGRDGARRVLERLGRRVPGRQLMMAYASYAGELASSVQSALPG